MRFVLVVLAVLLFPASAVAAPPDLGDTPWKCGHGVFAGGVSGCYGRDTGDPLAMDDAAVGDVIVSPKVAQLGDVVTVSAAHLPGWNPTGWPASAGGLSRRGTCDAAATTCTYLAVGVTNAWVRFGMTFASFATAVEQDYYAIVSEGRAITGRVQRRDPRDATKTLDAAGVKVSAAGPTPKSATTSPAGEYALLVSDGSYTVTTDGGYCLRSALPACRTTTTVTPAATADWSQPDPVKIEGTVTDEDGKVVRGVTVRADGVGGMLDSEVSNASGRYSLTVPAGAVRVKTDDENVCVKDTTASCERFKDLLLDRDSILNWQLKGCVREVSFGSMQAVNGCFKKVSDEVWQTDDPYLMNGIDVTPDGTATLDGHERRITYGGVDFAIGGESIGNYQGLSLNFNSPTQTIGGSTKGFTFKKIPVPGVSIEVLSEPGKSTLSIKLEGSRNLRALFNDKADNLTCPGKAKLTLTIQTTNATGLGKVGLKADSPQELFCAPQSANQPDNASAPSAIKLKNLSGDFDFSSGFWSIGAAVEGLPLFGSPNVTLTAKLTFGGDGFSLRGVAASLDGFDKPVGAGAFFFQRGGFDASFSSENGPFTFKLKAGFSLGPKNPWKGKTLPFGFKAPDELVSIDPTLSYTDRDLNPFTIDDTDLAGEGTIKLIDRDFFSGSIHYLPGPAAFTLDGRIGFNDPTGQIFKANGEVKGFVDGTRGILFARGRVYVSLPFVAPVIADLALNTEKSAWSACFSEDDNSHFGAVYHYDTGAFVIGGCDMATYTPKNPVASSAAAGAGKSFTVERGTEMLGVEIAGTSSAPRVDVRGPGLSLKRNGSKKRARVIVSEASKTTYLLLTAPRAGRYTLSGTGIKRLRFAGKAPEPKVTGSLSGDACAPSLRWKLTPRAEQEVRIVDTGADGSGRVLVPAAGRSGTLKLPGVVGDARRTVSAQVFQGGALRTTVGMGSYSASPSRPSAPTHLRVAASGKALLVSWARACGAARYVVKAGSSTSTITGTSLKLAAPRRAGTVRVTSVGSSGVSGGSATAPLEASAG